MKSFPGVETDGKERTGHPVSLPRKRQPASGSREKGWLQMASSNHGLANIIANPHSWGV